MILVSHAAFDHYGDAPAIAKRTGAPVVCDAAVRAMLIDDGVVARPGHARRPGVSSSRWPASPSARSSATTGRRRRCRTDARWSATRSRSSSRPSRASGSTTTATPAIFDMRLIGELYRPTVGLLGCTAAAGALAPDPRAGHVPDRRDGRRRGRAGGGDARARAAVACHYLAPDDEVRPLPRARCRTTTRPAGGAWSRRWSGETLVVEDGRHWIEAKEDAMRLVTYAAGGRTGVGMRRDGGDLRHRLRRHARADRRRRGGTRARGRGRRRKR